MERQDDRSPDVERAAQRLARPHARVALALKRLLDVVLALVMLVALLPLLRRRPRCCSRSPATAGSSSACGSGATDARSCSRASASCRAAPFGRALERIGARELPLLLAVLRGRLSFVGPRALAPGHRRGPHRAAAADGARPHRAGAARLRRRRGLARRRLRRAAGRCGATRGCSFGRCPRPLTTACRTAARRPRPARASTRDEQRAGGGRAARRRGITNGTRKSQMRSVSAFVKPSDAGDRDHGEDRERLGRALPQADEREPGDRHAEDQQERGGGAEQPVPVRAPDRDPDVVDLVRGLQRADRVEAGGEREQRVEARAAIAPVIRPSLSAGFRPSRARTRIAAQARDREQRPGEQRARRRARPRRATSRSGQQRDRGQQAERQVDRVGARSAPKCSIAGENAASTPAIRATSLVEEALGRARR